MDDAQLNAIVDAVVKELLATKAGGPPAAAASPAAGPALAAGSAPAAAPKPG